MEVTRVQVVMGGDEEEYELPPGEDLPDFMARIAEGFVRSRETGFRVSIKRVKEAASGKN